jgi:hypothetical protein
LATALATYSQALLHVRAYAQAESLLRECLVIREKMQPDTWQTFNTQSMLGGALLGQKKYDEAEPLLLKGYEGMKQSEKTIPPLARGRIPEALDRLIALYTDTNKPDDVRDVSGRKEGATKKMRRVCFATNQYATSRFDKWFGVTSIGTSHHETTQTSCTRLLRFRGSPRVYQSAGCELARTHARTKETASIKIGTASIAVPTRNFSQQTQESRSNYSLLQFGVSRQARRLPVA